MQRRTSKAWVLALLVPCLPLSRFKLQVIYSQVGEFNAVIQAILHAGSRCFFKCSATGLPPYLTDPDLIISETRLPICSNTYLRLIKRPLHSTLMICIGTATRIMVSNLSHIEASITAEREKNNWWFLSYVKIWSCVGSVTYNINTGKYFLTLSVQNLNCWRLHLPHAEAVMVVKRVMNNVTKKW